uniref:Secreted protein n=1 Tax=Amblyomma americanum TaxID=6943 RepID=A0A0C9S425_AMBAM
MKQIMHLTCALLSCGCLQCPLKAITISILCNCGSTVRLAVKGVPWKFLVSASRSTVTKCNISALQCIIYNRQQQPISNNQCLFKTVTVKQAHKAPNTVIRKARSNFCTVSIGGGAHQGM